MYSPNEGWTCKKKYRRGFKFFFFERKSSKYRYTINGRINFIKMNYARLVCMDNSGNIEWYSLTEEGVKNVE